LLLVEPISERRGGRLIDQAQNVKSSDAPRILRGLPLRIIEIGRNCDYRFFDRSAEISFRVALQLPQDERGNFRRCESLVSECNAQHFARLQVFRDPEGKKLQLFLNIFHSASHKALDRIDSALGCLDQVPACRIADHSLVAFVERDYRWDKIRAIVARDDDRRIPLHERHQGVRGAKIDADDVIRAHLVIL
jgi:hypothetical protein